MSHPGAAALVFRTLHSAQKILALAWFREGGTILEIESFSQTLNILITRYVLD